MGRAGTTTALGGGLLLAGLVLGAPSLLVPAAALLLAVVLGTSWVALAARGASVERVLAVSRVEEGRPLAVVLVVRPGLLPLPGAELHDELLAEPLTLAPARRTRRVGGEARIEQRGRHHLAPPRLVLRDPLGLAWRRVAGHGADTVVVLPRVAPVALAAAAAHERSGGLPALRGAAETDLDGLRQLRPGTPASRIHWAALARGAGLLERRHTPEGDTRPLILLDASAPASAAALDAAVRATGSLALGLARTGGVVVLVPGERHALYVDEGLSGWPALHLRLALVQAGAAPLGSAAAAAGRGGAVIYVTAQSLAQPPPALRHVTGTRIVVTPGALGGRAPLRSFAGCHAYLLRPGAARVPA